MEIKIRTFLENVISTKMKDYLRRTKWSLIVWWTLKISKTI
jgi:hypothetical protein